ncbi:MAG: c-type cytochrome [Lamprobacter sp.]|uniref:c-type cytochrome n=1 Tax=Lamprobacter sp. TaxID=3100796 RepID=UPI002B25DDF3|nr:c-type cytochrome [Lamprobacter sp.]MEA3641465.1 c-type cytochrome [Lamprobacter sp.]
MSLTRSLLAALVAVPLGLMILIPSASAREDYEARNEALDDYEPNLAEGEVMFRQCALCHGQRGQGILGGKYPRIAGFPEYYLMNALRDYQSGLRGYDAMLVVGGLKTYDDRQLMDLAGYISDLEIDLDVPQPEDGSARSGRRLYKYDCKSCHGRQAEGKSRKDSPPLRGQYHEYLMRQILLFQQDERIHADDPEDETFDEYEEEDLLDILAFIATLDDKDDKDSDDDDDDDDDNDD